MYPYPFLVWEVIAREYATIKVLCDQVRGGFFEGPLITGKGTTACHNAAFIDRV